METIRQTSYGDSPGVRTECDQEARINAWRWSSRIAAALSAFRRTIEFSTIPVVNFLLIFSPDGLVRSQQCYGCLSIEFIYDDGTVWSPLCRPLQTTQVANPSQPLSLPLSPRPPEAADGLGHATPMMEQWGSRLVALRATWTLVLHSGPLSFSRSMVGLLIFRAPLSP
jgi:hypothetical protein